MGCSIIVDFSGGPLDGKTWFTTSVQTLDDHAALIKQFEAIFLADGYDYDEDTARLIAIYMDWLGGAREIVVASERQPAFEHRLEEWGEIFAVGEKFDHHYAITQCLRDGSEVLMQYRFARSKRKLFVRDYKSIETPSRKTCGFF